MWPDPQKTADLVTFTEQIGTGKLHFLCSLVLYQFLYSIYKNMNKQITTYIINVFKSIVTLPSKNNWSLYKTQHY